MADILKPYLDRGQLKIIGATTDQEYEEYIGQDKAFRRRFERVKVLEPEQAMTHDILLKSIPKIEQITG